MGLYLISKAQDEIKDITQKGLFQKAEIRKRFIERTNENSTKIKEHFIETYNQFLNKLLNSTLSELKEKVLKLKNELINELETEIYQTVEKLLKKRFSNKNIKKYSNFLFTHINNITHLIDKSPKSTIILNSRDYSYFTKNSNDFKVDFKNKVSLKKADKDFIGGFKLFQSNEKIIYNYTIENLIDKNKFLIQQEFAKFIDETEIKNIQKKFEVFVQNQKLAIEEHLKKYDQVK